MNNGLIDACAEIFLLEHRKQIDRDQRNAMLTVLWSSRAATGLSSRQCEAIARKAMDRVVEIADEVHFSQNGRWQ